MSLIKKILGNIVLGLSLAAAPSFSGEPVANPEETYKRIFQDEENKVRTPQERKDFAKKLFAESQKDENKALEECLEDHAINNLRKINDKEAYEIILQIHQDDLKDFPNEKDKYLNLIIQDATKLAEVLPWNERDTKFKAYEFVGDAYIALGDVHERKGEFDKAVTAFDKAVNTFRYQCSKNEKANESSKRVDENRNFLSKAAEFKQSDALYRKLIEDFEKEGNEKFTPNGLKDSYVRALVEEISQKNPKNLVDRILECVVEDELETPGVMLAARVKITKGGIDYWDALEAYGQKAKQVMAEKGKAPEFNLEKALQLARKFDEFAKKDPRRYSRAELMKNAHGLYTAIGKNAQEGSLASLEAKKMVASLEEELKKFGDTELKLAIGHEIPAGAVLYMTFDEGTIVTGDGIDERTKAIINEGRGKKWFVKDLSGKGNHGLWNGGNPKLVSDIKGKAIELDGKNNYLFLPKVSSNLKPTSQISIISLIRLNPDNPKDVEILSMGDNYGVRINKGGEVRFYVYEGTGYTNVTIVSNKIEDGQWHQVVCTKTDLNLSIYIDGSLEKSMNSNKRIEYTKGSDLYIGSFIKEGVNCINGTLSEIGILDRALSAKEIEEIYKKTTR